MGRCWREISGDEVPDIKIHTPPENQGQIVTISFGVDWENNYVYCHWYDASDREEHWYYRDWKQVDGDCDFWNAPPVPTRVCGSERKL